MRSIIIYIPKITSRHRYVLSLMFDELYKINYEITDKIHYYNSSNQFKINYSKKRTSSKEIFIEAKSILSETNILQVELNFFVLNNQEYLFKINNNDSYFFDVFAAIFYLVTRYEEYLPHLKDKYSRYNPSESIAYQKGFLKKPIVNFWLKDFITYLERFDEKIMFQKPNFSYISTIDIDNAYFIKGKSFVRSIAFLIKNFLQFNFANIALFIDILLSKRKDPFDTYSFQFNLQKKYKLAVRYFVLLADYGVNDKNLSYYNTSFVSLIKRLSDTSLVGIHPSYASNKKTSLLQEEIYRLTDIQKREVYFSRQHFLQLSFPETYRRLVAHGITQDYTMGYASELGFRAGIASPFTFYDLDAEKSLPIKIFPFAITDNILKYNLKLEPKQINDQLLEIINYVKHVDGTLISVWHNDTFSNFGDWKGWKNVYEEMIKLIKKDYENN